MTPQIEAAVNWWADKLRFCKQSGLSAEERRDPANQGYQFAEILMTISKPSVTDEQIEKFKQSLAAQIENNRIRTLSVDYDPDRTLADALIAARIPDDKGTLPIKTTMWLDDGKVSVRYGYGAPEEIILQGGATVGAAAMCPCEGSMILMQDGTEKPIQDCKKKLDSSTKTVGDSR